MRAAVLLKPSCRPVAFVDLVDTPLCPSLHSAVINPPGGLDQHTHTHTANPSTSLVAGGHHITFFLSETTHRQPNLRPSCEALKTSQPSLPNLAAARQVPVSRIT